MAYWNDSWIIGKDFEDEVSLAVSAHFDAAQASASAGAARDEGSEEEETFFGHQKRRGVQPGLFGQMIHKKSIGDNVDINPSSLFFWVDEFPHFDMA